MESANRVGIDRYVLNEDSNVRSLVQEEGRSARNLLMFSVMVDDLESTDRLPYRRSRCAGSSRAGRTPRAAEPMYSGGAVRETAAAACRPVRRRPRASSGGGRARSVSVGRPAVAAASLDLRYWNMLLDSLRRIVDEIYRTCESDESVLRCKEAIMMLERSTQDFRSLINWLKIKWEYDNTPKPHRPCSVAWEIRKTGPETLPMSLVKPTVADCGVDASTGMEQSSSLTADTSTAVQHESSPPNSVHPHHSEVDQPESPQSALYKSSRDATSTPKGNDRLGIHKVDYKSKNGRSSRGVGLLNTKATALSVRRDRGGSVRQRRQQQRAETPPEALPGGAARLQAVFSDRTRRRPTTTAVSGRGSATTVKDRHSAETPATADRTPSAAAGSAAVSSSGDRFRSSAAQMAPHLAENTDSRQSEHELLPSPTTEVDKASATIVCDKTLAVASSLGVTPCHDTVSPESPAAIDGQSSASPAAIDSPCSVPPAAATLDGQSPAPPAAPASAASRSLSSSSLNSACSCPAGGSWADKVRGGLPQLSTAAAASADGVSTGIAARRVREGNTSEITADVPVRHKLSSQFRPRKLRMMPFHDGSDNDGEWKTVKPRTRSRVSSATEARLQRRAAAVNSSGVSDFCHRTRHGQPLSVASLPSLSTSAAASAVRPSSASQPVASRRSLAASAAGTRDTKPSSSAETVAAVQKPSQRDEASAEGSRRVPVRRQKNGTRCERAPLTTDDTRSTSHTDVGSGLVDATGVTVESNGAKANVAAASSQHSSVPDVNQDDATDECHRSLPADRDATTADHLPTRATSTPHTAGIEDRQTTPTSCQTPADRNAVGEDTAAVNSVSAGTDGAAAVASVSPDLDEDSMDEDMARAERALQSAIVEELSLKQQLVETENSQLEEETDGDSTSAGDPDLMVADGIDDAADELIMSSDKATADEIEAQYAAQLDVLPWGERTELLELLVEEHAVRVPGHGYQMHEKLSSPGRKKTLSETIRRHHERQAKATQLRQAFMEQKTQKLSDISRKIEEVRQHQEVLIEQRKVMLEGKMARAEEKRRHHLRRIVRRAHDEEEKAKEIAFINEIEAQNKRHDFYELVQTQEARLVGIQEERQRRLEEKAALATAAEEKRRQLHEERRAKLEEIKRRRRQKLERIDRELRDKEKERLELAREKQRDRDERLSALHAAQLATTEQLERRIRQKQQESARRHEENMEQIRQRALELSVRSAAAGQDGSDAEPAQLAPYDTKKMCTLCNVLIGSEVYLLSHLRGKQHQECVRLACGSDSSEEELLLFNLRHITDAAPRHIINMTFDKERHKALKKRRKKIRARMVARGESNACTCKGGVHKSCAIAALATGDAVKHKPLLLKRVKDLLRIQNSQGQGPWPTASVSALDRILNELLRLFDHKASSPYQLAFASVGGLSVLSSLLAAVDVQLASDVEILPVRTVGHISRVLATACRWNFTISLLLVQSNLIGPALDLLATRLGRLSSPSSSAAGGADDIVWDPATAALMEVPAVALSVFVDIDLCQQQQYWDLLQDVCSYIVCIGAVDKMSRYFSCVQGIINTESHQCAFLLRSMSLLCSMSALLTKRFGQSGRVLDRTGLIATLQVTRLVDIVPLLYTILFRQQQPLDASTLLLATAALDTLLQMAKLNLHTFQLCTGMEGRALEFRHVASFLLGYCVRHDADGSRHPHLLRLVVQTVGYFVAGCRDNQLAMQSGSTPTVLQQLLTLPRRHFSEPRLSRLLYPTLIACCRANQLALVLLPTAQLTYQVLENFMEDEENQKLHLISILKSLEPCSG